MYILIVILSTRLLDLAITIPLSLTVPCVVWVVELPFLVCIMWYFVVSLPLDCAVLLCHGKSYHNQDDVIVSAGISCLREHNVW